MEDLKYFIRQSQGFRAGAGKAGEGMMGERQQEREHSVSASGPIAACF